MGTMIPVGVIILAIVADRRTDLKKHLSDGMSCEQSEEMKRHKLSGIKG